MLTYTRYPDLGFTWFVSEGNTPIEDWLETIGKYGAEGMTALELYDLRRQTNLYSSEDIYKISEQTEAELNLRPPSAKTAILVDETVKYGLSRMYEMYAEEKDLPAETMVFLDFGAALEWIGSEIADFIRIQHPELLGK